MHINIFYELNNEKHYDTPYNKQSTIIVWDVNQNILHSSYLQSLKICFLICVNLPLSGSLNQRNCNTVSDYN